MKIRQIFRNFGNFGGKQMQKESDVKAQMLVFSDDQSTFCKLNKNQFNVKNRK